MATSDKLAKLEVLKAMNDSRNAMIATTEASTTASAAHAAGTYFILGGVLYKATADIAQGGTIVTSGTGQNCEAVTVAGEVSKTNGAVSDLKSEIDDFTHQVRTSNNFLPPDQENGYYSNTTGKKTTGDTRFRTPNAVKIPDGAENLYVVTKSSVSFVWVGQYTNEDADNTSFLSYSTRESGGTAIPVESGAQYIRVYIPNTITIADVSIRTSNGAYDAYKETTIIDPITENDCDTALKNKINAGYNLSQYFDPDDAIIADETEVTTNYAQEETISSFPNIGVVKSDGTIDSSGTYSGYSTTDYISLNKIAQIYRYFATNTKNYWCQYALYDAEKNFIPGTFHRRTSTYDYTTINGHSYANAYDISAEGAAYIRITKQNDKDYVFKKVPSYTTYVLTTGEIKTPNSNVDKLLLSGKVIVNLGDSIFGKDDSSTGISNQIAAKTYATVYNCAFGGTRGTERQDGSGFAAFDAPNLLNCIATDDYSTLDQALLDDSSLPSYFDARVELMKTIDFSRVDIITFNWGTNDYATYLDKTTDIQTALATGISAIQAVYPKIQFIGITPAFRLGLDANGDIEWTSDTNYFGTNKTLPEYCAATKNLCNTLHIPCIDAYNMGINRYNYKRYFSGSDGVHHNANGRIALAEYFSRHIIALAN